MRFYCISPSQQFAVLIFYDGAVVERWNKTGKKSKTKIIIVTRNLNSSGLNSKTPLSHCIECLTTSNRFVYFLVSTTETVPDIYINTSPVSVSEDFYRVHQDWLSAHTHSRWSPPSGRTRELQVSWSDLLQIPATQTDWCHLQTFPRLISCSPPQGRWEHLGVFWHFCLFEGLAVSRRRRRALGLVFISVYTEIVVYLFVHFLCMYFFVCCYNMHPCLNLLRMSLGFIWRNLHLLHRFVLLWARRLIIRLQWITEDHSEFLFELPAGAFVEVKLFLQMLQSVLRCLFCLSWSTLWAHMQTYCETKCHKTNSSSNPGSTNSLTFKFLQQQLDVVLVISVLLGEPAICIHGQTLHGSLHLSQQHLLLFGLKFQLFTVQM